MINLTVNDVNGQAADTVKLNEHTFKTGSRGFRANRKVKIHGKRYQANIQLVEIGSKPSED
jgi:hypothetical protein